MERPTLNGNVGRQQGFAYLLALTLVAVVSIFLSKAGEMWGIRIQREKEAELLFRGHEIRTAIARYVGEGGQYPRSLADLVRDPRVITIRRYLRKAYKDPMTEQDWLYVAAPGGGIMGVYSRAQGVPIKQSGFSQKDASFEGQARYDQWQFIAR